MLKGGDHEELSNPAQPPLRQHRQRRQKAAGLGGIPIRAAHHPPRAGVDRCDPSVASW